jgi:hypothetical protein
MLRLQDWLKTLRKKNVYVVFATQEIADAANSPILPTILSACPTKIYLPNEDAFSPWTSARSLSRLPACRPRRINALSTRSPRAPRPAGTRS